MKTIRIFSSVGIGDIITLGPLLKKLKSIYPESKITIISMRQGYFQKLTITKEFFYVDEVIVLNKLSGLLKVFKKSDLLILLGYYSKLSGPLRVLLYHFLFFFLRSTKKIKYEELELPQFKNLNTVEIKLSILKKLNIKIAEDDYDLFIPFSFSAQRKKIEILLKDNRINSTSLLAGIHVGSKEGYYTRFWSIERWIDVINYLKQNYNVKVVFIGAKDDMEETEKVIKKLDLPFLNLVGRLSVEETTALINRCSLFISTNSGPMWLAAALHKPQIVLCGPSKFAWDPYNKNAVVVRKIIEREYCNPPCDDKICHYKDNLCMKSIAAKDVLNIIDNLMISIKNKNLLKLLDGKH